MVASVQPSCLAIFLLKCCKHWMSILLIWLEFICKKFSIQMMDLVCTRLENHLMSVLSRIFYLVSAPCLVRVILKFEINKCYSTCSSVTFRFHFISRPIWMIWIMFIRFAWAFDNTNWSRKSLSYWHPNGHKLLTFTYYLFLHFTRRMKVIIWCEFVQVHLHNGN